MMGIERAADSFLRALNFAFAFLAMLAPAAHVLELPNKLALDGPLWLAVQQHLYRGWGPFLGGPAEIGALATSLALALARRKNPKALQPTLLACLCYAGMLGAFNLLNAPVNEAVSGWTETALPADWPDYRLRWEAGHALAAVFSVIAFIALLRARRAERVT
jgi:hypothetical protein